jgi:hypothetical protein
MLGFTSRVPAFEVEWIEGAPGKAGRTLLDSSVMRQRAWNACEHGKRYSGEPGVGGGGGAAAVYCDPKVANREIRVWHFVIENGY